jgi:hypothetical protein
MGKRSGVPHRNEELARLTPTELEAEIDRCRVRLGIAMNAKQRKAWLKRLHWLESYSTA